MGALLAKPISSSFRVWDLTQFKTIDYLNNLKITPIKVYLFGNKPVRILPTDTWISDRLRFSFDGWSRQRLSNCYIKGVKSNWYQSLAYFTKLALLEKVSLHWSSLESKLILPLIIFLNKVSLVFLPYTNVRGFSEVSADTYRWSIQEIYPTYESQLKPLLYKSDYSKTLFTELSPVMTSSEETELSPLESTFSEGETGLSCLVQTENITSSNFVYFGSHGYVNAEKALVSFPILMAYERSNSVTGPYFLRGPQNSRSLLVLPIVLMQLYSTKLASNLKKPYVFNSLDLNLKVSKNRQNFLPFFRQPPQYEVSPLVQIIANFIRYE